MDVLICSQNLVPYIYNCMLSPERFCPHWAAAGSFIPGGSLYFIPGGTNPIEVNDECALFTGGHESVGTSSQCGHILCFLHQRAPDNVALCQVDTTAASQAFIFNNARCCLGFSLVIRVGDGEQRLWRPRAR
jgi:hypothetical protein